MSLWNTTDTDWEPTTLGALTFGAFADELLGTDTAAEVRAAIGLVLGTDVYSKSTVDSGFVSTSNGGREVIQTHGNTGAAETIDVANGNVHIVTQDQSCTYTFTNPANATAACSFTLIMTAVTGTATWPASVNWPSATAPTLSGRCLLTFITVNGGTDWDGFLAGSGMA
jgi:hypothetical protein